MNNNGVWVRVDLINDESYIGFIDGFYGEDEEEDIMLFLEEQSYIGLRLNSVHKCVEEGSNLTIMPLDSGDSIYKSSMIIMNTDNILTIKFLKEDSKIVKSLQKSIKRTKPVQKPENVLDFKVVKKEYI